MGSTATGRSRRGVKQSTESSGTNGRYRATDGQRSDYLDPDHLFAVLDAVRKGDFSPRLSTGATGDAARIYNALNDIIEKNQRLTSELNRISEVVGKEGKIAQRADLNEAEGG